MSKFFLTLVAIIRARIKKPGSIACSRSVFFAMMWIAGHSTAAALKQIAGVKLPAHVRAT
jgi:hypothetical protein